MWLLSSPHESHPAALFGAKGAWGGGEGDSEPRGGWLASSVQRGLGGRTISTAIFNLKRRFLGNTGYGRDGGVDRASAVLVMWGWLEVSCTETYGNSSNKRGRAARRVEKSFTVVFFLWCFVSFVVVCLSRVFVL